MDILLQHPLKVKVSVRMFSIIDFLDNYTYSHLIVSGEGDVHAYIMFAFK